MSKESSILEAEVTRLQSELDEVYSKLIDARGESWRNRITIADREATITKLRGDREAHLMVRLLAVMEDIRITQRIDHTIGKSSYRADLVYQGREYTSGDGWTHMGSALKNLVRMMRTDMTELGEA